MKPKLPRKTILLSLILIAIAVVHLIYGWIRGEYQWIWIVLCLVAAVVNVLAERYLTSSKDAEDPEKRE
jgi:uncharacterized membrane protein YcjF (UPF0283 family)